MLYTYNTELITWNFDFNYFIIVLNLKIAVFEITKKIIPGSLGNISVVKITRFL